MDLGCGSKIEVLDCQDIGGGFGRRRAIEHRHLINSLHIIITSCVLHARSGSSAPCGPLGIFGPFGTVGATCTTATSFTLSSEKEVLVDTVRPRGASLLSHTKPMQCFIRFVNKVEAIDANRSSRT
jgi:hypothetical protein